MSKYSIEKIGHGYAVIEGGLENELPIAIFRFRRDEPHSVTLARAEGYLKGFEDGLKVEPWRRAVGP